MVSCTGETGLLVTEATGLKIVPAVKVRLFLTGFRLLVNGPTATLLVESAYKS